MHLLSLCLRLLTPLARAATVDQLGSSDPSVRAMWWEVRRIFPYYSGFFGEAGMLLVMAKVMRFVLQFIGGSAVAVVIYAGILMITSSGDDSKLAEAKKIATYAFIGLVLALLTDQIINYACTFVVPLITGGNAAQCPLGFF